MNKLRSYAAWIGLVTASGMAMVPPVANAQDAAQFAGQWGCRYSMEPFSGAALDTHYWEFMIALQPNGSYGMEGFYYSPSLGVQIPVSGEGSWGLTNDGPRGLAVSVEGQLLRQDSGWQPFQFIATPADERNLYLQFRGNTHFTNITCQR
jgi:hypothetical protein